MKNTEIQFKNSPELELEDGFTKGKIYHRVYFRIDTSTYQPVNGMPQFQNDHDREEFFSLTNGFFEGLGFQSKDGMFNSSIVRKGKHSKIHLHPDDLVGLVSDEELLLIQSKLIDFTDSHPIINQRWTDVTDTFEDISEEEIIHRVNTCKGTIADIILKALKTSRKTTFKLPMVWTNLIASSHLLKGFNFVDSPEIFKIFNLKLEEIVSELIDQGWIKTYTEDNGEIKGYRSANKEETRQLKRDIKASANASIPKIMQNSKSA